MDEFAGKVALVTGTSGIGRAAALRLAAGGAKVLACGSSPARVAVSAPAPISASTAG